MAYSVRHQVFVSSTFTDLVEERAEVIQALWELECIPTGMEAFVASNEGQWDMIKKVIDDSDYYVLIIGGRYGTVTSDGVSYTEREFRYARDLGVPVLAFVHSDPDLIPAGKTDRDADLSTKLDAFRDFILANYPVRRWSSASELGGQVSRSLVREIRSNPRPGWIRNDGSSPVALLERNSNLLEENASLKAQLQMQNETQVDSTLASGADQIEIFGKIRYDLGLKTYEAEWSTLASWDDIFRVLGPSLIGETSESSMVRLLGAWGILAVDLPGDAVRVQDPKIAPSSFAEVLVQLRALGLIEPGSKKRGINDRAVYWKITAAGDLYLVQLLAQRKRVEPSG